MEENSFVHSRHDGNGDVDVKLWRACAGPLVTVPNVGDMVYYLPQGHLEQVEAYTNQGTNMHIPKYNLPSEILCGVVNVQLKAEPDTDEVFAQLTLLPETKKNEHCTEEGNSQDTCQRTLVYSFCKTLTPSDTSTHGGFSVPKRHAVECLPPVDMSLQPPSKELVAKDLHGVEWHFRHVYRGQPKRHLLAGGWSTFVNKKKLVAGDAFIFLRGENGELRIGVRRAKKLQKNASAFISSHSMQLGILATASHAISTGTMFSVYYQPRSSPEFIIPYDVFTKAVKNDYLVGMRFTMKFEGEECQEQRLAGTIMGVEDVDPVRWPSSKWRCLMAKWDDNSAAVIRPDRVSPWQIELDSGMNVRQPPIALRSKKACIRNPLSSSSESYISVSDGMSPGSIEPSHLPPRQPGVLQGQEIKSVDVHELENTKKSCWVSPAGSSHCGETKIEAETQLYHWLPQSPADMASKNIGLNESSSPSAGFSIHAGNEKSDLQPRKIDAATTGEKCSGTCMLFGVDLVKSPLEPATLPATTSSEPSYHTITAPIAFHLDIKDADQMSFEQSKNPSLSGCCGIGRPCKDSPALVNRSCTKVHKYEAALGRSVDLTRFNGYEELLRELDRIFDFGGELLDPSNTWNVIYTDDEGHMMLVGDYPWPEFISMVRRMYVWPKREADKLNPCSSNTLP